MTKTTSMMNISTVWFSVYIVLCSTSASKATTIWKTTNACYGSDNHCCLYQMNCDPQQVIIVGKMIYGTKPQQPDCTFGVSNCIKTALICCTYNETDTFTEFNQFNRTNISKQCNGHVSCSGQAPRLGKAPFSHYVVMNYSCVNEPSSGSITAPTTGSITTGSIDVKCKKNGTCETKPPQTISIYSMTSSHIPFTTERSTFTTYVSTFSSISTSVVKISSKLSSLPTTSLSTTSDSLTSKAQTTIPLTNTKLSKVTRTSSTPTTTVTKISSSVAPSTSPTAWLSSTPTNTKRMASNTGTIKITGSSVTKLFSRHSSAPSRIQAGRTPTPSTISSKLATARQLSPLPVSTNSVSKNASVQNSAYHPSVSSPTTAVQKESRLPEITTCIATTESGVKTKDDDDLDNGVIIGLIIGILAALALIVGIIICLCIRIKRKERFRQNYIRNTNIFYSFPDDLKDTGSALSDSKSVETLDQDDTVIIETNESYEPFNGIESPNHTCSEFDADKYTIRPSTRGGDDVVHLAGGDMEAENAFSANENNQVNLENNSIDDVKSDSNAKHRVHFDPSTLYDSVRKEGKTKF